MKKNVGNYKVDRVTLQREGKLACLQEWGPVTLFDEGSDLKMLFVTIVIFTQNTCLICQAGVAY